MTFITTFTVCLLETSSKDIAVCAGNIMQRVTLVKSLYAGNFLEKHYLGLWFTVCQKLLEKGLLMHVYGFTMCRKLPAKGFMVLRCARNFLQKDLWFYSMCCNLRANTLLLKLIFCLPETSCKELHQYLDTACNFPQWVTSSQPSAGYFIHP